MQKQPPQLFALKEDLDMLTIRVNNFSSSFTNLDWMAQRIKHLDEEQTCQGEQMRRMGGQLHEILKRLGSLDDRMDSTELGMRSLVQRMDSMELGMRSLVQRMDSMERRMALLEERMDRVETMLKMIMKHLGLPVPPLPA